MFVGLAQVKARIGLAEYDHRITGVRRAADVLLIGRDNKTTGVCRDTFRVKSRTKVEDNHQMTGVCRYGSPSSDFSPVG